MRGLGFDDLGGRREVQRAPSRTTLVVGLYGGLTVVALLFGLYSGRLDLYHHPDGPIWLEGVPGDWRLWLSPAIGLLLGLLVVGLSRAAVKRFEWARTLHQEFQVVLLPLSDREILVMALASSIGEEALFRGAMVPTFGLWISTLLFAALHVAPTRRLFVRMLPWTASALVIGLALGGLYEATGDLGAPIAAHFVINYLNLRYIARTDVSA
jgi:membrane protease YdiL (CAAX protease family)